jgi:hypothetical protein
MNQPGEPPPETPKQVQELLDEISRIQGVEPTLLQPNSRHWQIKFTLPPSDQVPEEINCTLDVKRTPTGRITKPTITVTHAGVTGTLPDWDQFVASLNKNMTGPTAVPEMPDERPLQNAPSQVRRQFEAFRSALGPDANVRVGRQGEYWVLGIDHSSCDCDRAGCDHGFALRMYFRRKGQSWRVDEGRFCALLLGVDMSDQWRNGQATLSQRIAALLAGRLPDTSGKPNHGPPSGSSSATPGTANSVTVRKNTVIRN